MPRGPQPQDGRLFGESMHAALRRAVADLSWLSSRGYVLNSSLKLVGDRHDLVGRQRLAVQRAACSDDELAGRRARRTTVDQVRGQRVAIDGFNLIIIVESALAGGVLIRGRDGALRDLASVHGTYRRAEHTHAAIAAVAEALDDAGLSEVHWYLDQPVSNSGRLAQWLREVAKQAGRRWEVELVRDPDRVLVHGDRTVISSDGWVISRAQRWLDFATRVFEKARIEPWIVDLGDESHHFGAALPQD